MFNIPLVNRLSFLFFYLMSFQELLGDSLFTGIVLSSKTKQPISNVNIYTNQKSLNFKLKEVILIGDKKINQKILNFTKCPVDFVGVTKHKNG